MSTHGMILLPEALVYPILKRLHEGSHYERDALMDLNRVRLKSPHLQRTIQRIIQACQICTKSSPKTELTPMKKYNIEGFAH